MDILSEAMDIIARRLAEINPSDGVVEEAAQENNAGNTWALLLRPVGQWVYFIGYVAESGWCLSRTQRSLVFSLYRMVSKDDVEMIGMFEHRVQAVAVAMALMDGQP